MPLGYSPLACGRAGWNLLGERISRDFLAQIDIFDQRHVSGLGIKLEVCRRQQRAFRESLATAGFDADGQLASRLAIPGRTARVDVLLQVLEAVHVAWC